MALQKIEWLCDSSGAYSYARVIGSICILANLIVCLFINHEVFSNIFQLLIACAPFITGIILWLIEIFRDTKNFLVKFGDKVYSIKKDK